MKRGMLIRFLMLSIVPIVTFATTGPADGFTVGDRLLHQKSSQFAGGFMHTLAIKADGTLWAWGSNYYGQLGIGAQGTGDLESIWGSPYQVGTDNDWKAVFARGNCSFALKADGTLWAWGENSDGQLGLGAGSPVVVSSPVQIGSPNNSAVWTAVASGGDFTVALASDGTLWTWGKNNYGQLGDGTNISQSSPKQIGTGSKWSAIAAGGFHAFALKSDGSLWGWGLNNLYELGDGTTENRNQPTRIGTDSDWKAIAAGGGNGLALKANGTKWAWGYNELGSVGNGTTTDQPTPVQIGTENNWIAIDARGGHCVALKADGSLWIWGSIGDQTIQFPYFYRLISTFPIRVGTENNWIAVSGGSDHILTMRANGTLWSFGLNDFGQLGDESVEDKTSPVFIMTGVKRNIFVTGKDATFLLKTDGTLVASGNNDQNRLTSIAGTGIRKIGGRETNWVALSSGTYHSMAIKADGSLWAWGGNGSGQIGLGGIGGSQSYPARVGSENNWVSVTAGENHTIATKADGSLWGWGSNAYGQVGDGTYSPRIAPVRIGTDTDWVGVSVGNTHTMALKSNGTLWGWGSNLYGNVGVISCGTYCNSPWEVTSPSGNKWKSVNAGGKHTTALNDEGIIALWGYNSDGQVLAPIGYPYINTPVNRYFSRNVKTIGGDYYSMALKQDGSLSGWGSNYAGQISTYYFNFGGPSIYSPVALPNNIFPTFGFIDVSASPADHTTGIRADGTLWGWGLNNYGQIDPYRQNCNSTNSCYFTNISFWDLNTVTSNTLVIPIDESTGLSKVEIYVPNVVTRGETLVVSSNSTDITPTGFQLGDPPIYYNINTTATFSGQIKVCIDFSGVQFSNTSTLKLLHHTGDGWVDITADGYPDMVNKIICGFTTSLSPFTVVGSMVGDISGPVAPVAVGSSVSLSAPVTPDPAIANPTASWDWGDGTISSNIPLTNNNALAVGTHTYSAPGVYMVTLYLKNGTETVSSAIYRYVVVYDPAAGFVTGGGWIASPAGAYSPDLTLEGKATFGFVAKYLKGANTPTGRTEFQFRVANLNFNSQSYEWLVVAGPRAQFKGIGTINGEGDYGFMLTAIDGQVSGGGGTDKFRIKIWDRSPNGLVVYDNQMDATDVSDPTTVIGGGSIVIHK